MICTYTYRSVNSLGMLMNNIHYYCIKSRIVSRYYYFVQITIAKHQNKGEKTIVVKLIINFILIYCVLYF